MRHLKMVVECTLLDEWDVVSETPQPNTFTQEQLEEYIHISTGGEDLASFHIVEILKDVHIKDEDEVADDV